MPLGRRDPGFCHPKTPPEHGRDDPKAQNGAPSQSFTLGKRVVSKSRGAPDHLYKRTCSSPYWQGAGEWAT